MPSADQRGTWHNSATGNIIEINALRANLYNQSSFGCAFDSMFPAHLGLVKALEGAWITTDDDTLTLHIDSSLETTDFEKLDALPDACRDTLPPTPHNVFMAMWTVMDENYAFFDLHGVNWNERRALAPSPDETLTDQELYQRLQSALTGLDDGHVQLIAGDLGFFSPSVPSPWNVGYDFSRDDLNQIARANSGVAFTEFSDAPIAYGLRDDGIGYILIEGMYTDSAFGQLGSNHSKAIFKDISEALAEAKALVIDVRYNPGGNDTTAFAYASHFSPDTRTVFQKRSRDGDGWTPYFTAHVNPAPAELQLDQPVVLLTSSATGSGAEIFTMAMRELPQVTVMGTPTDGGLSDILGMTLPNGWKLGLSNQEYRTMDGSLFEGSGVPVDITIEIDSTALQSGKDPVLAAAFEFLNSQ